MSIELQKMPEDIELTVEDIANSIKEKLNEGWDIIQPFEEKDLVVKELNDIPSLPQGHTCKILECQNITDKEINFINNTKYENGIVCTISKDEIETLLYLNSCFVVCYDEKTEVTAIIQSTIVPFSYIRKIVPKDMTVSTKSGIYSKFIENCSSNTNLAGVSSRLTVRPDFQSKSYCIYPISQLIKHGYKNGIYYGYHLTDNTLKLYFNIPIKVKLKILDYDQCLKRGFNIPNFDESNTTRNKLIYKLRPSQYQFKKVKSKNDIGITFNYLMSDPTQCQIKFQPNMYYWTKFCEIFNVFYCINSDKKITDLYAFSKSKMINSEIYYYTSQIIFATSNNCIRSVCEEAAKEGSIVLYIHELGNVKFDSIYSKNERILNSDQIQKLSFYNFGIVAEAKDVFLPIF